MGRQFSWFMRFDPRMVLRVFAVLVFVGLSGLAIATLLVSRGPIAAEVIGSPTPPEHSSPPVSEVLDTGNVITRAPDGEAYVQIRYDAPEAFRQLIHVYRIEVLPQNRIITAALKTSDDGTNWKDVAEAGGENGFFAFDLRNAGAHKFWKMIVVRSGDAPEVVFGRISFVKERSIIRSVPVDLVWLGLLPASVLILISFQLSLSLGRLFTVTALPVALFVLLYSLGYADFHTAIAPDSWRYLQPVLKGSYSSFRNAGYPTILLAVHNTIGLDHLAWVQGSAGIACYLAGAWLLAVRFGNKWIGLVLALAVLLQGSISQFAPHVLTEALFMAGLGLFAAALGALAWRPERPAVIAAAIGIILVILTKSIGVVLLLPALLLIRFLPKGKRLSVSGVIVISGLATYALMGISSFTRTGALTESSAGYSLIGHVGWMLDDAAMPPSDLTRTLISAAAPVVEKRPADLTNIDSLAALNRYVDITVQDYNTVLWQKLVPIAKSQLGSEEKIDSFFWRFGLSSIRAHPSSYIRHVTAHFYGMWRDLGQTYPLRLATVDIRRQPVVLPLDAEMPGNVLTPYPSEEIVRAEIHTQSSLPLVQTNFWSYYLISPKRTVALGALALLLSILFLIPSPLAYIYRTEIMIALSLNAYFGAHVLLQVSLQRYATAGVLAAIFLAVSFVFTSVSALKSLLAARVLTLSEKAWRSI
jgi:hypothetical protein